MDFQNFVSYDLWLVSEKNRRKSVSNRHYGKYCNKVIDEFIGVVVGVCYRWII